MFCEFNNDIKKNLEQQIEVEDRNYYWKFKQQKYIKFKGFVKKTLIINNIKLTIKTRYYYDFIKKEYLYPVYEKYKIEKRKRIPKEIRMEIAKRVLVYKQSYYSASIINNDLKVSKSTVLNCVKEFKNLFEYQVNIDETNIQKDIFICVDDTFRNLRINNKMNKFRFRVINFYQGKIEKNYINQVKLCLAYKINSNIDQHKSTMNNIYEILNKYYQFDTYNQKIIVCGDGAKYIDNISKNLNSLQVLDKFHCYQNLLKVFNFRSIDRSLTKQKAKEFNNKKRYIYNQIKTYLELNMFDDVYQIIDNSVSIFKHKMKIIELKRLKNYLKKHQNHIENWKQFSINPTLTETYIQQIIKSNFGNLGKVFSKSIFEIMLKTKCICYCFN